MSTLSCGTNHTPSTPPTVVIADDEQDVRDLMRELLEECGFTVFEASSGETVLEAAAGRHIDLVVLDLVMPGMEGLETLRALRREYPNLKVMVVSGAFGGSFLRAARILGANAVLKKPFSCELFLERVGALLDVG